ncbi:MAG: hypothetical protein GXO77_00035 [Calditrichaeota bacterium]|nr:hypothetical protein [Calditrichota bacterium]
MALILLANFLLWGSLLLFHIQWQNRLQAIKWLGKFFVINSIAGIALGWLSYFFLGTKIGMIVLGLILLISGFRWIGISKGDFFSWLVKRIGRKNQPLISSYSMFLSFVLIAAQLKIARPQMDFFAPVLVFNFLLAGYLLLLSGVKLVKREKIWAKELVSVVSGIYLTVIGLIIMSGDVNYFVTVIENILHIFG